MLLVAVVIALAYLVFVAPLVSVASHLVIGELGVSENFMEALSTVAVVGFLPLCCGALLKITEKKMLSRRKLTEVGESSEIRRRMEKLCRDMDMPEPKLMVQDDPGLNGYALGRKGNGTVVLNRGLVENLGIEEIEGILAHEVAHLKNRDVVILQCCRCVSAGVGYVWRWIAYVGLSMRTVMRSATLGCLGVRYGSSFHERQHAKRKARKHGRYAKLFVKLFSRSLSRNREYYADETAVKTTGNPEAMVNALKKVRDGEHNMERSETASLYIHGIHEGLTRKLLASHPKMEKRINRIESKFQ